MLSTYRSCKSMGGLVAFVLLVLVVMMCAAATSTTSTLTTLVTAEEVTDGAVSSPVEAKEEAASAEALTKVMEEEVAALQATPRFNRTKLGASVAASNNNTLSQVGDDYDGYQLSGTYYIYPNSLSCNSNTFYSAYSMKTCYTMSGGAYMYMCGGSSSSRTLIKRIFSYSDCSGTSYDSYSYSFNDGTCYYLNSGTEKLTCSTDLSSLGAGVVAAIVIVILFVLIVGCVCTLSYCGAIMLPGWCIVVSCCRPRERPVAKTTTMVMLPTQGYVASDGGQYAPPHPQFVPQFAPQQPYYAQQQRV